MFGMIMFVIVGGIAALLGFAATKPNAFHVERSIDIKARPDRIFPFLNDFHRWREWSPWENVDPDLKRSYAGPASGKGSAYEWEGKKAGSGRMEIKEITTPSRILIQLNFTKPFKAQNTTKLTLEPRGDVTHVIWSMDGPNLYIGKLMSTFMSMDKMIGKDYEKGLATLKGLSESSASGEVASSV